MSVENRELLKRQLEQQGKMIVAESNEIKLIQSILSTCSALLRVAEKSMPASFSQEEFNGIYAGFLGLSSKVNSFYKNHKVYISEDQSIVLNELLESLHSLEDAKRDLDSKISAARKEATSEIQRVDSKKSDLEKEQKRLDTACQQLEDLQKRLSEIQHNISELENEKKDINDRIANFEPDVEKLIHAVNDAKTTYAEMIAYYAELERIQKGIREEGYVDIVSFTQKLQEMNAQGNDLMTLYDELLRNVTADVEALQRKIEMQRKAGAAG